MEIGGLDIFGGEMVEMGPSEDSLSHFKPLDLYFKTSRPRKTLGSMPGLFTSK